MPARHLVGTPRGTQRCGGCGHARYRHLEGGAGECSFYSVQLVLPLMGEPTPRLIRCDCQGGTYPKARI